MLDFLFGIVSVNSGYNNILGHKYSPLMPHTAT